MMGFGSYVGHAHGGGSSNLSALAPPFTVDRSIPKPAATPLVDLGDSLNWFDNDTNPYSFNSPQSAQLPPLGLDLSPTSGVDLFQPKTYYPSYVSPPLHVPSFNEQSLPEPDHTVQWSGGLWEWDKGNSASLGGSFYSKETNLASSSIYTDHMNLGAHPPKSINKCEEASYNVYSLGKENQVGPASLENLDYNLGLGQNPSFTPMDYLKTSVIGSSSAFPETSLQAPPLNIMNSQSNQVPYSSPYEKPLRQHNATPSDGLPTMKSSPGIVIRPPAVGTSTSASNAVPFKNINTSIYANDSNLTGNNPPIVKEPHYSLNFGSKKEFDPSQLSFHLDGNYYFSGESSSTTMEKLSTKAMVSNDATDYLIRTKSGVKFPCTNPDNFSLIRDKNEAVISVENSLDSLDHHNPPVDSPCWKGAPASHNSPFGSSEPVAVQVVKKLELCDGSNGQALKFFPMNAANMVNLPVEKPGENFMSDESGNVEDGLISSWKVAPVSVPTYREYQRDGAGKTGSCKKRASFVCEMKFSDDASEQKRDVLFDKPVHEVEKASRTSHQNLADGRLASKNIHTSEIAVADLEMKTNYVSGCSSSHMSGYTVNNSCLPSFTEDVSTKHTKFSGEEPVSKSSISILVDTIHNMSELLLYHCSNEASELKEKDIKSLQKVINNLDSCLSKNIRQESVLSELHESTSMGRSQVSTIDFHSHQVQDLKKHSGKKEEKCSDMLDKSDTDTKERNDKMTQAIKKVLSENFHEKEEAHPQVVLYKNLWLEAEAALCSVNYMARFNNMKIEIEKYKLDSEKDLSEDKISKSCVELNTDNKFTAVAESGPTPDVSNQNSPSTSSSNHADDVMARFHILTQRLNNANSAPVSNVEELSSTKLALDLDEGNKMATELKDSSNPGLQTLESSVPGIGCHIGDIEASVMDRFHILKSRGNGDLDFSEVERELLPDVDSGFGGKREKVSIDEDITEDAISGHNLGSILQDQAANNSGEQLVAKDCHVCVKHDSTIQSPKSISSGNQLSAGWYDCCSSDWELLLKEELSGQKT